MLRALAIGGVWFCSLLPVATRAQDRTEEARGLFEAGVAAYEAERFDDALAHFARCHELTSEPALLYNMARAAEGGGRHRDALAHYTAYRASAPPSETADLDRRIEALRAVLEMSAASPASEAEAAAEPPLEPAVVSVPSREPALAAPAAEVEPSLVPWVVVALGAAASVAGATLAGLWAAASDSVTGAADVDWSSVRGAYDDAFAYSTASVVLLSIGAVAVAAGLVWASVDANREVTVEVGLGPGVARLRGRF